MTDSRKDGTVLDGGIVIDYYHLDALSANWPANDYPDGAVVRLVSLQIVEKVRARLLAMGKRSAGYVFSWSDYWVSQVCCRINEVSLVVHVCRSARGTGSTVHVYICNDRFMSTTLRDPREVPHASVLCADPRLDCVIDGCLDAWESKVVASWRLWPRVLRFCDFLGRNICRLVLRLVFFVSIGCWGRG